MKNIAMVILAPAFAGCISNGFSSQAYYGGGPRAYDEMGLHSPHYGNTWGEWLPWFGAGVGFLVIVGCIFGWFGS